MDGEADVGFESMGKMAEFVAKRWRDTVDIWTEEDLEVVPARRFFLLRRCAVTVYWNRFNKRSVAPNVKFKPRELFVIDILSAENWCRLSRSF